MTTYCGYIALVGRPNVGKSTLLNNLMSKKVSITSRKPQTTRHRVLGIQTIDNYQYVFVDTPGIHRTQQQTMNQMMNQTALNVLHDVDVIWWLIDATRWTEDDELVHQALKDVEVPVCLIVNKIDKIKDKETLLPKLQEWQQLRNFFAMIPISAKTGAQVSHLLEVVRPLMPDSPHLFYADQTTDRPVQFQISEILREKIFRYSGDELPYATTVEVESMKDEGKMWRIHALIWVDKASHKRMLIGAKGEKMKLMATEARQDMEKILGKKVFLHCFCKVKSGWAEDVRFLREMGLDD
ncbi:MAG: GTPase Era [Gammaproteobacteria bacterium]|nr:GTPase Era [Gammaproteobacteria bacterium]